MKIGVRSSHAYNAKAGGYKALYWHIKAFLALGHEVDFYTTNTPCSEVLENWFDKVPIRFYSPGIEKNYDTMFNCDHFSWALPLAKKNYAHIFFPQDEISLPPDGVKLYSNSEYTARHIRSTWNVEATPMYIPIDQGFHSREKERIILHVSRFAEPSKWADKAHRQMIQAFKFIARKLPNWKLVMAGSIDMGQYYYFSELTRLASGYNIDFRPDISQNEIIDLYAKSSIYWHATGVSLPTIPSAQEHMGIAPLEAEASGCVPIVYNSGGMPEVVLNHKTGLLFDNIMDLPHITLELANNMTAWAQMSQAGRVWAQSWADLDAFVKRIDDMLNDRPITPLAPFGINLKHAPSEVTIVIPTFNSPLLGKCLSSLKETAPTANVVVINNGDALTAEFLQEHNTVEFINAERNLGFGGAYRLTEGTLRTPFILMLNDDIVAPNKGWLEHMLFVMNHDNVGIVGAKLLFPNGNLQHSGGRLDLNNPDIGFHMKYGQPDCVEASVPSEVDFVTGACMLVRRELFHIPDELLDGYNFEEAWMSLVAREKGFKTVYQPAAVLTHFEGETKKRTQEMQDKIKRNKSEFLKRWNVNI